MVACESGQREQDAADIRLKHDSSARQRATTIGERESFLWRSKGDLSYGMVCVAARRECCHENRSMGGNAYLLYAWATELFAEEWHRGQTYLPAPC